MLEFQKLFLWSQNMRFNITLLFVATCIFSGCASHSVKGSVAPKIDELQDEARVIDAALLKSGGSLFIAPFRAGPGVEVDDRVEKVSLMAFKGIIEVLQKERNPFKIVTSEDEAANFVLKGHIVALWESRGMKKWVAGQEKSFLGIAGQMVERTTGKTVMSFSYRETAKLKKADYKSMAYRIGQRIGEFILEQLK